MSINIPYGYLCLDLSFRKYDDIFKNYKNSLKKSLKLSHNTEFTVHKMIF